MNSDCERALCWCHEDDADPPGAMRWSPSMLEYIRHERDMHRALGAGGGAMLAELRAQHARLRAAAGCRTNEREEPS